MPKFEDNFSRPKKKIVVEVGDGVAHARAVNINSDTPDYIQKFGRDLESGLPVEEIADSVESEELVPAGQEMKKKIGSQSAYLSSDRQPKENLKTLKKNTPHKYERVNRGDIREFIGKN